MEATRKLFRSYPFKTLFDKSYMEWQRVSNNPGPAKDRFRVYVNPVASDLKQAVSMAENLLLADDSPCISFKYLKSGKGINDAWTTKLVFYCGSVHEALFVVQGFMGHPLFGELSPSRALQDTIPLNNLLMISGGARENIQERNTEVLMRTLILIEHFQGKVRLHNGAFGIADGNMGVIPADPRQLSKLISQILAAA